MLIKDHSKDINSNDTFEIVHDSLFQVWEQLRFWLEKDQDFLLWKRRLQNERQDYQKKIGLLLRQPELGEANQWLRQRPNDLEAEDKKFIQKSLFQQLLWRIMAGSSVAIFGCIALTALFQLKQAQMKRLEALLSNVESSLSSQSVNAAIYAIAAYKLSQAFLVNFPTLFESISVRSALLGTVQKVRESNLIYSQQGRVLSVILNPDDSTIISGGSDGSIKLWDIKSGVPKGNPINAHNGGVNAIALSEDGNIMVSGGNDGTVRLWNLRTRKPIGSPLQGSKMAISSVAISEDSQMIVSGGYDGTVHLWNSLTGEKIKSFTNSSVKSTHGIVYSIAISQDSNLIFSGRYSGQIDLWDVRTGKLIKSTIPANSSPIRSIDLSRDQNTIVSGGHDAAVRFWQVPNGEQKKLSHSRDFNFKVHKDYVNSVAISKYGNIAVSGSSDGTVVLWNSNSVKSFKGHRGYVNSVALSADETTIVSGGGDGTLRVWDIGTEQKPLKSNSLLVEILNNESYAHWRFHKSAVQSNDGHTLVVAGQDGMIRLWDVQTGKQKKPPIQAHRGGAVLMAISEDGQTVASGGQDGMVRLWDVQTCEQKDKSFQGHRGSILSVDISGDGYTVASGGQDGTLRLWDIKNRENKVYSLKINKDNDSKVPGLDINSVSISKDGHTVATSQNGTIRLWDISTGKQKGNPFKKYHNAKSIALNADGSVITSVEFNKINLWDVRTGKQKITSIQVFPGNHPFYKILPLHYAVLSGDGSTIVSEHFDSMFRFWDINSGKQKKRSLQGPQEVSVSMATNEDGNLIAVGYQDGTIRILDLRSGKQVIRLIQGNQRGLVSMVMNSQGDTIASSDHNGAIYLWDVRTGTQKCAPLQGHGGGIFSVAISMDGRTLASAGQDGTVRLWDILKGEQKGTFSQGHRGGIVAMAMSADGRTISSRDQDGVIRLWDVRTGEQKGNFFLKDLRGHNVVALSSDGTTIMLADMLISGLTKDHVERWWNDRTKQYKKIPSHQFGFLEVFPEISLSHQFGFLEVFPEISLWDTRSGMQKGKSFHTEIPEVSFDGSTFAFFERNSLNVFDFNTNVQKIKPLVDIPNGSISLTEDGRKMVSGGKDGSIRLWDVRTGKLLSKMLGVLRGEKVSITADGNTIFSHTKYGNPATVSIWDIRSEQQIGYPFDISARFVAPSADGNTAIIGGSNGVMYHLDISSEHLLSVICNRLYNHPMLIRPRTSISLEAKKTCEEALKRK